MPNNNDNYEYMKFLDLSGAQQIWNTAKQTFVQTVNGVGIDANGNVNVGSGSFTEHEVQFVKDEYNKTLNLFDKNAYPFQNLGANGSYSANNLFTGCFLLLKAGTYTLSFNRPSETQFAVFGCSRPTYDANTYSVFDEGWQTPENDTYTFTFTQDLYFGIYVYKSGGIVPSLYNDLNIMLNKGSSALPYQAYNGAITHQKDVEAVLLWENATPTSSFASQTISNLPDMSKFKYLIFVVSGSYNVQPRKILKYGITGTIGSNAQSFIDQTTIYLGTSYHMGRGFVIPTNNQISFDNNYTNSSVNNNDNIPIAIYGTNL